MFLHERVECFLLAVSHPVVRCKFSPVVNHPENPDEFLTCKPVALLTNFALINVDSPAELQIRLDLVSVISREKVPNQNSYLACFKVISIFVSL
jgi:hypothetical protein